MVSGCRSLDAVVPQYHTTRDSAACTAAFPNVVHTVPSVTPVGTRTHELTNSRTNSLCRPLSSAWLRRRAMFIRARPASAHLSMHRRRAVAAVRHRYYHSRATRSGTSSSTSTTGHASGAALLTTAVCTVGCATAAVSAASAACSPSRSNVKQCQHSDLRMGISAATHITVSCTRIVSNVATAAQLCIAHGHSSHNRVQPTRYFLWA